MLSSIFSRPRCCRRLASSPDIETLQRFARYLRARNFGLDVAQSYIRVVEHFGTWLRQSRRTPIKEAKEQDFEAFIRHLPLCHCPSPAPRTIILVRAGLRHFKHCLERRISAPVRMTSAELIIAEYFYHLKKVAGLAESTCTKQKFYAEQFLRFCFNGQQFKWRSIRREQVVTFVTDYGHRRSPATAAQSAIGLRSFLRFLSLKGLCDKGLILAVPHIARWKLASLPRVMSERQIAMFVNAIRRNNRTGIRDLSMVLFQLELGMRVSEVAATKLDDVDWRNSTLTIRGGKTRRVRVIPIPPRLYALLSAYVLRERPQSKYHALFLRRSAPKGYPVTKELIRGVVRRAYAKIPGTQGWTGTHILRHTAASRMHRQGVPLKDLADILGHASIDTTAIYTKIDIEKLRNVSLPWPGRAVS